MLLQKKQILGLVASLELLQQNIDGKTNMAAVNTAISTAIAALVDGAPTALDTLKELATLLQGEETALNALIITVDEKLNKSDVVTDVDLIAVNPNVVGQNQAASVASYTYLKSLFSNAQTDLTSLLDAFAIVDGKVSQLEDDVSAIYSSLDGKVSGIKNQRIDTQLDMAAYTTNNGFDFTLPSDSMQALDVKVNGQVFPVGTGEAFNINGSTAGNGKYNSGDTLALDGTKLGFTLEATDKIYVTLVSTI